MNLYGDYYYNNIIIIINYNNINSKINVLTKKILSNVYLFI